MEKIMEERGEKATGCTSGVGDPDIAAVGSSETQSRKGSYISGETMTCSVLKIPQNTHAQEGLLLG